MEEEVKRLAELKAYLEKRLKELEEEVNYIRTLLSLVDEALSKRSFVPAAALAKERVRVMDMGKSIMEITLTARTGEALARMEVFERGFVVRPLVKLNCSTPPFQAFLVNRILEGAKRRDEERVARGEIPEDEAFSYEIIKGKEGYLKEIRVYNYGDRQRLNDLRGAIRWTLNRMYERERG